MPAHKAELKAPTRALHLGAKKKVTIYTNSMLSLLYMHMGPYGKREVYSFRKERN